MQVRIFLGLNLTPSIVRLRTHFPLNKFPRVVKQFPIPVAAGVTSALQQRLPEGYLPA